MTTPDKSTGHQEWIDAYVARNKSVFGKCKEATEEMAAAFPELKRVPGHVEVMGWGRRAHWWLETADGEIVDPTVSQFPMVFEYEPFEPGSPVRVGRCMDCGDDIYDHPQSLTDAPKVRSFCNDQCAESMAKSVGW